MEESSFSKEKLELMPQRFLNKAFHLLGATCNLKNTKEKIKSNIIYANTIN